MNFDIFFARSVLYNMDIAIYVFVQIEIGTASALPLR